MSPVELQFLGSGDAFGSGGRFQTCLLLRHERSALLIDCGASSLIAMKRAGVDPAAIGWVLLTHLHGDHFGGLPFLVLDGQFSRRTQPLVIAGPAGTRARLEAAMEIFFPGSSQVSRRFSLEFLELQDREPTAIGPASVRAFPVQHPSGAPAYALRVAVGDKVIAYSGDTEWTEDLLETAREADLFVCEAYCFEKKIKHHLDYQTLMAHRAALGCRRLILTHMSGDMLSRLAEVEIETAADGQRIVV
ncbi:MAG TPA: MBL fold metallo-hydrolase [Methylomirabilota bacterium]|nr:MBL fold metallo-hydrolase [Methylomirabilota bacterium]